ncbi:MAG: MAPEG family protein, partial [Amylibacter sp.]
MLFQITPLYAAFLAVIFLVYTMRVIKARSAAGLSILHGDDMELALKVRIHANFADFVPIALIVLMLAEMSGGNGIAVHVAGALLIASRILIPFGMDLVKFAHPLRIIGKLGTHISIGISVVLIGL